jgi:hypothetical protein
MTGLDALRNAQAGIRSRLRKVHDSLQGLQRHLFSSMREWANDADGNVSTEEAREGDEMARAIKNCLAALGGVLAHDDKATMLEAKAHEAWRGNVSLAYREDPRPGEFIWAIVGETNVDQLAGANTLDELENEIYKQLRKRKN